MCLTSCLCHNALQFGFRRDQVSPQVGQVHRFQARDLLLVQRLPIAADAQPDAGKFAPNSWFQRDTDFLWCGEGSRYGHMPFNTQSNRLADLSSLWNFERIWQTG